MSTQSLITFVLMALATYLTRIGGYLILRNRKPGPRVSAIMDAAPGCVLISVIAPRFASGHLADMGALAITIAAASRLSMLPTVLIAVTSAGVLRHCL